MTSSVHKKTIAMDSDKAQDTSCLDASIRMLHENMDNAKAYDFIFPPKNEPSSEWWLNLFQKMQEQHTAEKKQWQEKMQKMKERSSTFKTELQGNLQQRLQSLETRVQKQSLVKPSSTDSTDTAPTTSTNEATLDSKAEIEENVPPHDVRVRELQAELLKTKTSLSQERQEWEDKLQEAAKGLQDGAQLSKQMQTQLLQIAEQIQEHYRQQRKQWKEKTTVLEQLLDLTEQQHATELSEWKKEREILEKQAKQLRSDKDTLQEKMDELQKTSSLQNRKITNLQKQLELEQRRATVTQAELVELKTRQTLQYPILITKSSTSSPQRARTASPKRVQWEESLDRAMAERDIAQQEANHAQKLLRDFEEQMELERDDFTQQLEESEEYWRMETQRRISEKMSERNSDLELFFVKSPPSSELERRYRESVEKRNDLVVRLRKIEQKHSDDKIAWKLQLESALAKNRQLNEIKIELEGKIDAINDKHASEVKSLKEQTGTAEADLKRQIALLKTSHAEEIEEWTKWSQKVENMDREFESQLSILEENHRLEVDKWKEKYEMRSQEYDTQIKTFKDSLDEEFQQWIDRVEELANADKKLKQAEREIAKLKQDYDADIKEWKDRVQALENESSDRINAIIETHREEMHEHKEALTQVQQQNEEHLKQLKLNHEQQISLLEETLMSTQQESQQHFENAEAVADELDSLQTAYNTAKEKWLSESLAMQNEMDRLLAERNCAMQKLDSIHEELGTKATQEYTDLLESHEKYISRAIGDLQNDIDALREMIESSASTDRSIENANYNVLREDLGHIHSSLNDAVSRLVEETKSTNESRNELKTWTQKASDVSNRDYTRLLEQQERLLGNVGTLQDQVAQILSKDTRSAATSTQDKIRLELLSQLQQKESRISELSVDVERARCNLETERKLHKDELAKCTGSSDEAQQQFQMERAQFQKNVEDLTSKISEMSKNLKMEEEKRRKAEREVQELNDQADAYSDELMHLQSVNTELEKTLADAEKKLQTTLLQNSMNDQHNIETPQTPRRPTSYDDDDSMPMLDEALALAQGLTDVVHGGEKSSVMDMLEALTDMMDKHDQSRTAHETSLDAPPAPVSTPHNAKPCSLELVVDQLYARCHLLERERTDLMETTMDLLQAAREANAAELEAALASTRRRAAEELVRIRDQTQQQQWRLFDKLCGECRQGLLLK